MKRRPASGITLIELLIAAALLSLLALAGGQFLGLMTKTTSSINRGQSAKTDLARVINGIGAAIFNAALLEPQEGLLNDGDGQYKGIFGLGTSAYHPACRYAKVGGVEEYSVLRVTSITGRILTETLLRPWGESDLSGPNAKLRISYHNDPAYPYQLDGGGNPVAQPEVYLIDGDNLISRRYRVARAAHVVTDREPYADVRVPGATYTYTELTLRIPVLLGGGTQSAGASKFISGSTVYATNTSVFCVSASDGKLIRWDEAQGSATVVYDPSTEGMKISKFNVSYLGTQAAVVLQASLYGLFPTSLTDIGCVNAARISLELQDTRPGASRTPIRVDRQVLINNANLRRPAVCN